MKTSTAFICEAIRSRRLLEFRYRGLQRVVAPYCHGTSTAGMEVLRAVQIRGASGSKGCGFGKLWSVADVERPRLLEEVFVPDDPDYNPNDKAMREIHCRIEI
jgi:hypothetical protein